VARRQQELLASDTRLLQQETVIKNALSRNGVASPALAEARIIPTDRLRIDPEMLPPLPELVETAMQERPEVEQTQINIENTQIGISGNRSLLKPSLEASAFANNNALIGQPNALAPDDPRFMPDPFFVGGYGDALGQLLRRNFPDYGVSVTLNIPLRNRSARADYIRETLQLRQQQLGERRLLNNIRVEVMNAEIAVRQARALYDAAVKERELQEETLEAEQKKYALGASTVFFVIQYQRDLAQAQSNEVAALAALTKAKVDLNRAIGRTLETYRVDIAEAQAGMVSRAPDLPVNPQQ
jgi:outer membrane protein TolC